MAVCLQAWRDETGNSELPVKHAIDYLWEALAEQKRDRFMGRGVFLSTVHFAKGMEFDHVAILDGGWRAAKGADEEERRVYYVAMTRAKQTLTIFQRDDDTNPYCSILLEKLSSDQVVVLSPEVTKALPESVLQRRYELLGLKDVYLDYAGRKVSSDNVHQCLLQVGVGDAVKLVPKEEKLMLCNEAGRPIAVLAKGVSDKLADRLGDIEKVTVQAMVERRMDDSKDPDFRKLLKAESWEVPVVEVVYSLLNENQVK
ncbi:MAG: ATP-binding domain-containing protein [Desulfuromonadales bacterium]|nr:ATP-binding domain-containing protein [Desulfuromonadales bacterium]MBN2791119.1 ATP-binding domain-containing protein [Desulfuromonadales bacterium]